MPTIDAFEKEIKMQVSFLQNFVPQKPLSILQQKKTIFCGTGDSFVSAQVAEAFSDFRARALDPLDLIKNKKLAKKSSLYLISVSGNTISNIRLAKIAKNATAITANSQSRLGKACKNLILLDYPNAGIFTAGSISFVASMMTCISLVSKIKIKNISGLYESAKNQCQKVRLQGKIFLIGNAYTFSVAMFAAAKIYEVAGLDAHYERMEQFSHMGLFSAKKGDTVIIFEEKNPYNTQLKRRLEKYGFNVIQIQPNTKNIQEMVLFFVFVSEFIALNHAKKKNQKDCFFVRAKKLRNISSSMIY
jgi:fructoselysine-6-P-deglycase FrlB-like protein